MSSVSDLLQVASHRVVVVDGAMGTSIQDLDLPLEAFDGLDGCNEVLVRTRPDCIAGIHSAFLDVGCDVVETNSFGGAPWVLAEYGLADETEELNRTAAQLAVDAVSARRPERAEGPWALGALGPGTRSPTLSLARPAGAPDRIDYDTMLAGYRRQARGLLAGGVDGLIVETVFDLLQAKAAVWACHEAMAAEGRSVPLLVSVTIERGLNTMLLGSEVGAALVALEPLGVDVLGLNCATGPEDMREHVRTLADRSPLPISVIPNAGIPDMVDGRARYPLTPAALATAHREMVTDHGVQIVGGCCGTTPAHLQAVVEAVSGLPPAPRPAAGTIVEPSLSSLYAPVTIRQESSFLVVGERINANGSRKVRDLLAADDLDAIAQLARDQVREGAHALDVCVDYVGRDGVRDMADLVNRLATDSTLPLVIDSTQVDVIRTALTRIGGRAVINSVNLEDGRDKADHLLGLARQFGAAVVCLAIDERGQARTTEWKVEVCRRIAELAAEHGIGPEQLIFDTLTFPLGSGQEDLRGDGVATLDAIERVKAEIPGCHTVLGVSNVSFGLDPAARQALNSVFLHLARERGLDAAIVHAGRIQPLHRIDERLREICVDLILDRRGTAGTASGELGDAYDPLMALMEAVEGSTTSGGPADRLEGLDVLERLEQRIVDGLRDGLADDLDLALGDGHDPLDLVNVHLLAGMRTVGELFGSGQMQLPFVLQSAETMKAAVAHLEPHMERVDDDGRARIVLATVKGDVHDIGKNLVDIILTNNGYAVRNIGIKQPIDAIIDAVEDFRADAIGLSGLLVKSTVVMGEDLEELQRRGMTDLPVLLGGAALTRPYVEGDLRGRYDGPLFYCRDAFSGLKVMDELMAHRAAGAPPEDWGRGVVVRQSPASAARRAEASASATTGAPPGSDVATDVDVPTPPFWGSRVVRGVPLDDALAYLNRVALFRTQWGLRADEETGEAALRSTLAMARSEGLLVPQVAYGYWACNSDGDDVVIYEAPDSDVVAVRWTFPRQSSGRRRCIADFVRPVGSGERDVIALQAVTVGERVSTRAAELFAADRYTDYLYLHGVGVETAEALAELWHARVRAELGIADEDSDDLREIFRQGYRGSRYSFGYAACPDLELRADLFELLDAGRIGLSLSESFQLHPEQATDAFVLHHPQAKYFNAR